MKKIALIAITCLITSTVSSQELKFNNGFYGFPSSPGEPSWFINGKDSEWQPVTGDGVGGSIGVRHDSTGYFYFNIEDTDTSQELRLALKYMFSGSDEMELSILLTNGISETADEYLLVILPYTDWSFTNTIDIGAAINTSVNLNWGDDLYIKFQSNYVDKGYYTAEMTFIDYVQLIKRPL